MFSFNSRFKIVLFLILAVPVARDFNAADEHTGEIP